VSRFNQTLESIVKLYDLTLEEGIRYEQYMILLDNNVFLVKEGDRVIGTAGSLRKAQELINSIISGC